MKLYLDPGHGGTDPGAQGNGLSEKDVVLDIAKRIRSIITKNYRNVDVKMSRTSDTTKSLRQRTNEANSWGADFYLSIHCNSFNGKAYGYEDYIYTGLRNDSQTAKYQDILHEEITKVNQLHNRGQKKANFHVLRETTMDALLSENGFIDHKGDASLMKQASWRDRVAQGHVNGIAKAFNLTRKKTSNSSNPNSNSENLYKVIVGSFQSKKNADNHVTFLKSKGVDAFVTTVIIAGKRWYRVQSGAFSNRKKATNYLNQLKNADVHGFIIES